ncbi:MAG: polysaccharide deacetylase, partial [Sphingomonadales bacterium]|nr:polysaccharide deacetylase [Sphingomonadales bacterium]
MTAERAIFYDPTGRRRKRFRLALLLFFLLVILSLGALAATIRVVPTAPLLPVALERGKALPAPRTSLFAQTSRRINLALERLIGTRAPSVKKVGAKRAMAVKTTMGLPLSIGFYVPWDPSSTASLQRHIGDLDWLAPVWLTVTGANHQLNILPDPNGRAILNTARYRPLILPVVQNAQLGQWDSKGIAAMLADPRARATLLDRLTQFLETNHASGAVFDFEQLDPVAQT